MTIDFDKIIREVFARTLADQGKEQAVELSDDTKLLESGLDSLGFAVLVMNLEDELGYDPFTMMDTPYYPQTFGDFVDLYRKSAGK